MATINTIENRILEMDGGEFQKLCDAYLAETGYGKPQSFGGIAGTNKVKKGTPDTFFERPNGKFVFAEYTTQQENLFKKLGSDLGKCLDENKTKVPISNLEEIVICYTSQLSPSQVLSLRSKCEKVGVKLTPFGIRALANDLLNHPLLVHNYLDLPIDTGQVIPLESFTSVYGRSKFATTLDTKFHFREKEIEQISDALETNDLVVISGKAGIGKSRFALEGCRNFIAQHDEFRAYSVVSISQNLYEDLQERFSLPGQYLILVDDANRVISFSYFMHFLRNQKQHQHIKIVVTVRDYALDRIENDISSYPYYPIRLDPFTDEQIKELAKDEFGILNPSYLERIIDISGGNPRIAVMISKIAVETNSLQSINDVSALYDEYFSSIKDDLQNLAEPNLLKTAGIIAFLRAVDRTNEQLMARIQQSFHISPEIFWNCAFRLHELEMVDMYENEVVRISDQVLSTYLFYLAFFKEKILDFSDVLANYFPNFRSKIIDALNPVLSAFDQNAILNWIRPKVQTLWKNYVSASDDENLLILAEMFWHLLPTETLALIQKRFSQSQFAPADFSQLDQLDENKLNNISIITELRLLGYFRYATPDLRHLALELLLDYLNKRPLDILQVLHLLVHNYGFDRFSHRSGISIQREVVDLLWERTEHGENELFSRLLISVGQNYLKTRFHMTEMHSKNTVTFYDFTLQPTPELFALRALIFSHLFTLYKNYQKYIFVVLENYIHDYHHIAPEETLSNDAICLMGFIQTKLSPKDYSHNIFVNDYLDFLENRGMTINSEIRNKFQNDAFLVYKLLSGSQADFIKLGIEEYRQLKKERFTSYFSNFSDAEVRRFIDICIDIEGSIKQDHTRNEIISGFYMGLNVLAETKKGLFEAALEYYLCQGDKLNLNPSIPVKNYMANHGKDKTLTFLNQLDYPTKKRWLFGYYQALPPEEIDANDLPMLYKLFEESEAAQLPGHLDFLLNYVAFDKRFIAKVTQLILEKNDPLYFAWTLSSITNPYSDFNKRLVHLFKEDVQTLKEVYLIVKAGKEHADHNSVTLSKILDLDPEFIVDYVEWLYTPKENVRWYHDSQDYSTLWKRHDYQIIFKRIIELVYRIKQSAHWYTELRQFFMPSEEKLPEANIQQKQEELLAEIINTSHNDIGLIEFLFEVIAYFPKERRSRLIFAFLQNNKNFCDFQQIELETSTMLWSGSAVPVYQKQIDDLKSLLPMLNTVQLLEHRSYIENRIAALENQKSQAKKRDFIGEDDF